MEEKIIKRNYEKNFQKYLWNQYDTLHDRLTKKIGSLSKILSQFNDIYHVKKEYYKNLRPLIKEEPQALTEEESFKTAMVIVKNNNEKFMEFEEEMYNEIIDKIRGLIDKMKAEKNVYDEFKRALSYYTAEKAKMESLKSTYHSIGQIAERATLYFKDLIIKKKINDQSTMNQAIEKSKLNAKNMLSQMSKDCNNYVISLKSVNKLRVDLNKKQNNLLLMYQNLEWDDKNLYSTVMEIIRKYQKKILDFTGKQLNDVEIIQKAINIEKDIRGLVAQLRRYDSPEEEILYEHYPISDVDFDKCSDSKDYKVCDAVVKEMKQYCDNIFETYDEKLEEKKNKMRELIYKFFDKNRVTTEEDKKQLLEYINDERTHTLFLIVLAKLRTNNRFCRDKFLIELLSEIILKILDKSQEHNDLDNAKNCLILSQTFFYYETPENQNKIYISNYIRKHPWFKTVKFWGDFILTLILNEFKKIEERNKNEKMNISLRKNIPESLKSRLGEVLFSQLLPYVGNMKELQVDNKIIFTMIETIINKYPFIDEASKGDIYKMVCSQEELGKIKEEVEKIEELKNFTLNINIIKEFNKNRKYIDEDDYDDF